MLILIAECGLLFLNTIKQLIFWQFGYLKGTTLSNSLTYYEDAINGLNLNLTIDFRLQSEVRQGKRGKEST